MADRTILEKCITLGPWGSTAGSEWVYVPEGFVKKIRISHDAMSISSIEFHSSSSEGATQKSLFGSLQSGNRTDAICIDYPDEYLMSLSGTDNGSSLASLCFHTNQNRYGPYGDDKSSLSGNIAAGVAPTSLGFHTNQNLYGSGKEYGRPFSYDGKGGVIVGFHGCRSDTCITAIGFYVMPKSLAMNPYSTIEATSRPEVDRTILEKCITFGPWGGAKGDEWVYVPEGFIKKIRITHGVCINSIEFHSCSSEGATQKTLIGNGGLQSGKRMDAICFEYPDEYLMSISGTAGAISLASLCFHTNQNRYGPYGRSTKVLGDHSFSYDGKGGVIAGLYGRRLKVIAGFHERHLKGCITAIGFYVMPKLLAMDRYSTIEATSRPQKCCRMAMPREVGPWGASGGKLWDDGVFSKVKQVCVYLGEMIYAIQIEYVKTDGKSIWSPRHGDRDGDLDIIEKVNLDGMNEYLTGISGFYGPIKLLNGSEGITSITLHTNKKKYGPYGQKSGAGFIHFTSTASPGKVVGFHGRDNNGFLSAIGVHME